MKCTNLLPGVRHERPFTGLWMIFNCFKLPSTRNLPRPPASRRCATYHKTRDIYLQSFRSDIKKSSPDNNNITSFDEQIVAYEKTLRSLFDKHAPLLTRTITVKSHSPLSWRTTWENWGGKEGAERKYLSTRLKVNKHIYQDICRKHNRSIRATKASYYKKKVEASNQKQLFKCVDELFNIKCAPALPKHDFLETLAESFAECFESRIINLRCGLSLQPVPRFKFDLTAESCRSSLTDF